MNHDHKFKRYDLPAGGYTEQCVVCGEYLPTVVDRLTSDKARLANELAAEQESNTFLNNLHGMDVARVETLEVVLRRVQTALDQTSPVLWKALKAAVNEVLTPTGTPTNPTMQHAPDCPILHGKECLCDPFPLETEAKDG